MLFDFPGVDKHRLIAGDEKDPCVGLGGGVDYATLPKFSDLRGGVLIKGLGVLVTL